MQLAIGKTDFARVLANVGKVIESRNTIPILSHVRLQADSGTLRVTGTDLDIVATDTAPADIGAPGAVCVDAKLLASIVSKAAGDITLETDGGKMIVKSGRSRFTLSTLPTNDFPDMPDGNYMATFDVDLAALFAPCVHAISNEETRYYLNGVFFNGKVAASTDGHRLVKHTIDGLPDFAGIIVPRKVVGLLPKGIVNVSVSDAKIRLQAGPLTLVSKLIDGTFPDYERVIPKENDKVITFDNEDMRLAAARVSVVSSERGRAVKMSFAPGGATLEQRSPDNGDASDEIEIGYTGEPIQIGLNSQYLAEMLGQFPGGEVTLALGDPGSPTVFKSDKAANLLGVLMPVRI